MEQSKKQYSSHTPSWQTSTQQAPTSLLPTLMQNLGLETFSPEPSLQDIQADLTHSDWTVRAAAIQALATKGTLTDPVALKLLAIALQDVDATVRAIACRIVGNQPDTTLLDHLMTAATHDPDWHVYETTLRALRHKELLSFKTTQRTLQTLNECVEEIAPQRKKSKNKNKVLLFHADSPQRQGRQTQFTMQSNIASIIPISEHVRWTARPQKTGAIKKSRGINIIKAMLAIVAILALVATWPFLGPKARTSLFGGTPPLMHSLSGNYTSLAWVAGGSFIILRQLDKSKLSIWNTATNQLSQTQSYVVQPGVANDTATLATSYGYLSATAGHMLRAWNVITNNTLLTYNDSAQYWQQTNWSPDGKYMTALSKNGVADIWNIATKGKVQIENYQPTDQLSWSPSGDLLAEQSLAGQIHVINGSTGEVIQNVADNTDTIHFFSWSPTGARFVTSGEHTTIVWNTLTGEKILTRPDAILTATWGNDQRMLATTINMQTREASIQLWDTNTGQTILNFSSAAPNGIYTPTFTPDGRLLITHSGTDTTQTWDTATGKTIATYHISGLKNVYTQPQPFKPLTYATSWIALSPDGHYTAASGVDNSTLVWNTQTGNPLYTFAYAAQPSTPTTATAPFAWSSDGQRLAVIGNNATVAVLQTPTYTKTG